MDSTKVPTPEGNGPPRVLSMRSENVDCREGWLTRHAIPQINGEADVAGPQRIAAATDLASFLSTLRDRSHREGASAFKPDRIPRPPIELEERVAVTARAVTKIG